MQGYVGLLQVLCDSLHVAIKLQSKTVAIAPPNDSMDSIWLILVPWENCIDREIIQVKCGIRGDIIIFSNWIISLMIKLLCGWTILPVAMGVPRHHQVHHSTMSYILIVYACIISKCTSAHD